jgi:putative ABC transport system substrate-binding protein
MTSRPDWSPARARRRPRLNLGWWLCAFLLFSVSPAFSAPLFKVSIVVSSDNQPYMDLADGVTTELGSRAKVSIVDVATFTRGTDADVVVAIGLKAMRAAAAKHTSVPVLNTLVPRATFNKVVRERGSELSPQWFSAIYLDQPIARQLELVRLVFPAKKRVGVVLGPDSEDLSDSLTIGARTRGLDLKLGRGNSLTHIWVTELDRILLQSDVFLSLPDAVTGNAGTIQTVLFAAYRREIPVVGFSPAYVRAGALLAIHSTSAQLARQVSETLRHLDPKKVVLPPPQWPRYFSVAVNYHVAHSLSLDVDTEEALAARLKAGESKP